MNEFQKKLQRKLALVSGAQLTRPEKLSLSQLPITRLQLFGRNKEIDRLNIAWHESKINCLQIVAFGGVGKSSLVNSWLSQLDRDNYVGAEKVYGWSFYCQDIGAEAMSSGDFFIQQALQWFGEAVSTEDTPWSKVNRLANLIRKSKTLLILDALESLQYPPGPRQGTIKNPAVALLIRELAANNNGLCIITSRIAVSDLSPFDDGRIQSLKLDHLAQDDGVKLPSSMGIKGDISHMVAAVNEYVGHPLCLSLLGSYLSVVHGADISNFKRLESLADVQSHDAQGGNIVSAYLKWFRGTLESSLLNLLGLFDCGVSLADVKALTKRGSIPGLTKELSGLSTVQWSYAIQKLHDANLIFLDDRNNRCIIYCHPLVRDFLGEHIKKEKPDIWRKGSSLIFYYLQSHETESPGTTMQSEFLFRAVMHGSRAGLYKEVFQLYFEKIMGSGVRRCEVLSTLH